MYADGPFDQATNAALMHGQVDGSEGHLRQVVDYHHGFPTRSHHVSQLTSTESSNASNSQLSLPQSFNSENYQTFSTSSSSFESNWPNKPAHGQSVPIEQYRALQAKHNEVQLENANLVKDCIRLEAQKSILMANYNSLIQRMPAFIPVVNRKLLKREDYPNILYWFRHEYITSLAEDKIPAVDDDAIQAQATKLNDGEADGNDDDDDDDDIEFDKSAGTLGRRRGIQKGRQGKKRASQGENVKMRYIQYENGEVIDGWRAKEMRHYARSIFVGLAQKLGQVFSNWGEGTDLSSRLYFHNEMVARFPELGLCELDWKAEQIGCDLYYPWRKTWVKKETAQTESTSKRPSESDSQDTSQKKQKTSMPLTERLSQDPPPANFPLVDQIPTHAESTGSVPHINIVNATPMKPSMAMGHVAAGSHLSPANLSLTPFDACPSYQFPINQLYPVTLSTTALPSPLPAAQSQQSTQGSSQEQSHSNTSNKPKGSALMRPNKHSTTPRNLCALEWKKTNKNGTSEQFGLYWEALPPSEIERWKALSNEKSS
ncbi:hypothetical protein CPB84DRAFT_1752352 [Gymnopilus junonius]|uniref:Uncharacterized protein n=1 Tax=Gymnopilus junonius TaxID=109634 RepID=A0A9P5N9K4_GYMJU|nr:hypothetical protein CPB84DRAFT_1752352 [Gymnopilus junonius]